MTRSGLALIIAVAFVVVSGSTGAATPARSLVRLFVVAWVSQTVVARCLKKSSVRRLFSWLAAAAADCSIGCCGLAAGWSWLVRSLLDDSRTGRSIIVRVATGWFIGTTRCVRLFFGWGPSICQQCQEDTQHEGSLLAQSLQCILTSKSSSSSLSSLSSLCDRSSLSSACLPACLYICVGWSCLVTTF